MMIGLGEDGFLIYSKTNQTFIFIIEIDMEWKAHNYTLEYKNWKFKLSEGDSRDYFFVNIYYKDNGCSMYVNPSAKTAEEAKERVENFIKTELK